MAAKVSNLEFRGKEGKFPRHFNGIFPIGNVRVRSLPGQPATPAFRQATQEKQEWAGNAGFSRVRLCLQTPKSTIAGRQSPQVSDHTRGFFRFAETVGADRVRS